MAWAEQKCLQMPHRFAARHVEHRHLLHGCYVLGDCHGRHCISAAALQPGVTSKKVRAKKRLGRSDHADRGQAVVPSVRVRRGTPYHVSPVLTHPRLLRKRVFISRRKTSALSTSSRVAPQSPNRTASVRSANPGSGAAPRCVRMTCSVSSVVCAGLTGTPKSANSIRRRLREAWRRCAVEPLRRPLLRQTERAIGQPAMMTATAKTHGSQATLDQRDPPLPVDPLLVGSWLGRRLGAG